MDDLPELRDIHLPDPIVCFPLGYGMISLMVIVVLFIFLLPYLRSLYLKSKRHYALKLIDGLHQNNMENVCRLSELLRRICKIKHKKAVALYGQKWADFLKSSTSQSLSGKALDILMNAPYAPSDLSVLREDFDEIKKFTRRWVEDNL